MGNQQVILLVLGTVIVGAAIFVGVKAYSENSVKANYQALEQDALRIASDAQSWKSLPARYGRSPDDRKAAQADFTRDGGSGLTFIDLGYPSGDVTSDGRCFQNANGQYRLVGDTTGLSIVGSNSANVNMVTVFVRGVWDADVDVDEGQSFSEGQAMVGEGTISTVSTCDGF